MGIPPEVPEHLRGPPKRALRIDDPGRRPELREEGGETPGVGEGSGARCECQVRVLERAVQSLQILGAEDDRQRLHRKQKTTPVPGSSARDRVTGPQL